MSRRGCVQPHAGLAHGRRSASSFRGGVAHRHPINVGTGRANGASGRTPRLGVGEGRPAGPPAVGVRSQTARMAQPSGSHAQHRAINRPSLERTADRISARHVVVQCARESRSPGQAAEREGKTLLVGTRRGRRARKHLRSKDRPRSGGRRAACGAGARRRRTPRCVPRSTASGSRDDRYRRTTRLGGDD